MTEEIEIVSIADHIAGFKVVTVQTKLGKTFDIRLSAPSRHVARHLAAALVRGNMDAIIGACLPEGTEIEILDTLTPQSLALVQVVSTFIAYGVPEQKKIVEAADRALLLMIQELKSKSSAAGIPLPKSTAGASLNLESSTG